MPDIVAAIDETAAQVIVTRSVGSLPALSNGGAGTLGPFGASWSATASFSGGTVDLIPPPTDVIRISNCRLDYSVTLTLSVDLSFLNFCLPRVCVPTPWGPICTPRVCVTFPTISIPVTHSSFLLFSGDFRLNTLLTGGQWLVNIVVVGVPSLTLGSAAIALLGAIGAAVALAVSLVPGIGPLLALAVAAIMGLITVAAATGLLGGLLTPFVTGLTFTVYRQPQLFQVIPPSPPDPAVSVNLDSVSAAIVTDGVEDELVINVDISA